MKKIICLILALVFCVAMACTVFANDFVSSPSEPEDGCDHNFVDGICTNCGMVQDNPGTGDTSMIFMWIGIMVVAALGLVTVTVAYRKKFATQ